MRIWAFSLVGLMLFLWPFLPSWGGAVPADAPAYAIAIGCSLVLLVGELGLRQLDSRRLALLAALAAVDAGLRWLVVVGLGGFSPIFFLILCAGWVFGPSYGFLVGSFSLLVSALVTGGVGPWLPYQMLAAGWVGVAAGLSGFLGGRLAGDGRTWGRPRLAGLAGLALVGIGTGYLYGALTDVQTWTTGYRGTPGLGWAPGMQPLTTVLHFARFYLATSLAYDTFRAAGNALAILVLGLPVIAALGRLRGRLTVEIVPEAAWPADQEP
jgi:energy-coupling factor transport system substrate-specific component